MPSDLGSQAGAEPPPATNLSASGAASNPAIVALDQGLLRAFWWDAFDGLVAADGQVVASSMVSGTEQVTVTREIWSKARAVPLPVEGTPEIAVDGISLHEAVRLRISRSPGEDSP